MYICLNKSVDFDVDKYSNMAEYIDQIGFSVEFCESIFTIFHLNHSTKCRTLVIYIYIYNNINFRLMNLAKY